MSIPGTSTPSALPAGGGATLPDDPAAVLLDAGSPDTFVALDDTGAGVAATAAQAQALLGLVVTPALDTATGWTTTNGSGTASIVTGSEVARLALGTGVVPGSWASQPKVTRASTVSAFAVDFRARIAAWTNGNSADVYLAIGLRRGTAGVEGLFCNIRGNGGSVDFYSETVSGGGSLGLTATPTRGDISGGQFWVRMMICPTGAALFYGVGSGGAEPAEWLRVSSTVSTAAWQSSYLSTITLSLDAIGGGSPDNVSVDIGSISTRILGIA